MPFVKQSTLDSLKGKGKRAARAVGGAAKHDLKGSAVAAGVGAGVHQASHRFLDDLDFVKDNWYAKPLLFGVGGHLARKKYPRAGSAAVAVAGYLLSEAYTANAEGARGAQGAPVGAVIDYYAPPAPYYAPPYAPPQAMGAEGCACANHAMHGPAQAQAAQAGAIMAPADVAWDLF